MLIFLKLKMKSRILYEVTRRQSWAEISLWGWIICLVSIV